MKADIPIKKGVNISVVTDEKEISTVPKGHVALCLIDNKKISPDSLQAISGGGVAGAAGGYFAGGEIGRLIAGKDGETYGRIIGGVFGFFAIPL